MIKSYITEVYVLCNGNNILEIAINYIDKELIKL